MYIAASDECRADWEESGEGTTKPVSYDYSPLASRLTTKWRIQSFIQEGGGGEGSKDEGVSDPAGGLGDADMRRRHNAIQVGADFALPKTADSALKRHFYPYTESYIVMTLNGVSCIIGMVQCRTWRMNERLNAQQSLSVAKAAIDSGHRQVTALARSTEVSELEVLNGCR